MILAALMPPEIVVFSDIIRNRFRARSEALAKPCFSGMLLSC